MLDIELHYSEELIIKAVKSFFRRKLGVAIPVFTVIITAFTVYNIIDGDRSWMMGAIATLNVMLVLMVGVLYLAHRIFAIKWFHRIEDPVVMLSMDDEKFHVASSMGTSHLKWELIKNIWVFDGYFLVVFSLNEFVTVPTDHMTPDAKAFFFATAQKHGTKFK